MLANQVSDSGACGLVLLAIPGLKCDGGEIKTIILMRQWLGPRSCFDLVSRGAEALTLHCVSGMIRGRRKGLG